MQEIQITKYSTYSVNNSMVISILLKGETLQDCTLNLEAHTLALFHILTDVIIKSVVFYFS